MRLVIDYVLEGENRGYNFVTPTAHLPPDVVKLLWRSAMPRGQGWGAYTGARALKCLPLQTGRVAFVEITVTGRQDESGRQGLRRAEITVFNNDDYTPFLETRWRALPETIRSVAEAKLSGRFWRRVADSMIPRMGTPAQIVLTYPFTGFEAWQVVEACVFKLALTQNLRAMKDWLPPIPFTTLALDYREESRLVALPQNNAALLKAAKMCW